MRYIDPTRKRDLFEEREAQYVATGDTIMTEHGVKYHVVGFIPPVDGDPRITLLAQRKAGERLDRQRLVLAPDAPVQTRVDA